MDKGIHKYISPYIYGSSFFSFMETGKADDIYILIFLKAINSLKYIKERKHKKHILYHN